MYHVDILNVTMDITHVHILSQALKEWVITYYHQRMDEYQSIHQTWSFWDAILDMQDQFLHKMTALNAAYHFEHMQQEHQDVQGLLEDLQAEALQMVKLLMDYAFCRRFMEALQSDIAGQVVWHGRNTEQSSLHKLVKTAVDYEEALNYAQGFNIAMDCSKTKPRLNNLAPVRNTAGFKKLAGRLGDPNNHRQQSTGTPRPHNPPANKPNDTYKNIGPSCPMPTDKRPQGGDQTHRAPDLSKIECWQCGKKGHFPNYCPNLKKGQAYTAWIKEDPAALSDKDQTMEEVEINDDEHRQHKEEEQVERPENKNDEDEIPEMDNHYMWSDSEDDDPQVMSQAMRITPWKDNIIKAMSSSHQL
jgi:hypothetical protein